MTCQSIPRIERLNRISPSSLSSFRSRARESRDHRVSNGVYSANDREVTTSDLWLPFQTPLPCLLHQGGSPSRLRPLLLRQRQRRPALVPEPRLCRRWFLGLRGRRFWGYGGRRIRVHPAQCPGKHPSIDRIASRIRNSLPRRVLFSNRLFDFDGWLTRPVT
jgi:hypothetical protein